MNFWEIETFEQAQSVAWILADAHASYRAIGCDNVNNQGTNGEVSEAPTPDDEVVGWLDETSKDGNAELLLIPMQGAAWLVLTQFYLSSGCYLFVRVPDVTHCEEARYETDEIRGVSVYPAWPEEISRPSAGDFFRSVEYWRTVMDCIPHPSCREQEWEEMSRLMRAVSSLVGMDVVEAAVVKPAEDSDIAQAEQDFGMLAVMLMLSLRALRACGIRTLRVSGEAMEEGTALTLTASDFSPIPRLHLEKSEEMRFCNKLAEQNAGIFSCLRYDDKLQLTLCAARKDFALLGVKLPSQLLFSPDMIWE